MKTQTYTLHLGPQHPSTHGVLHVILELDGENIVKSETDIGYLHRGIEKLAESRKYPQVIPYTDRLDYLSGMSNNLVYVATVEKMMEIEVPERAKYIRVIISELMRIANHMVGIGIYIMDLGAVTGVFYPFIQREYVLELFSKLCGSRMTFNYMRIGGVAVDIDEEFIKGTNEFLEQLKQMLNEYHTLIDNNEIFLSRTKNVGKISLAKAESFGLTGPNLRASGSNYDLRKVAPYEVYDRFDFNVATTYNGDCFDRYIIRMMEIEESMKIIQQALKQLPEGEVNAKVPRIIKPGAGDCYHQAENPKGILGCYIVSDGTPKPYRVHFRRPSYNNIAIFDEITPGHKIADFIAIMASFDFVLGEVDA